MLESRVGKVVMHEGRTMRLGWQHGGSRRMLVLLGVVTVGVGPAFPASAHGRYFAQIKTDATVYVAPVASPRNRSIDR